MDSGEQDASGAFAIYARFLFYLFSNGCSEREKELPSLLLVFIHLGREEKKACFLEQDDACILGWSLHLRFAATRGFVHKERDALAPLPSEDARMR